MMIRLNGEVRQICEGMTLEELVSELKLLGQPIAVELNREIVPKNRFGSTPLRDGDRLEIVTFVGGG
jgi:thiamine biosynthesis protein ThiS